MEGSDTARGLDFFRIEQWRDAAGREVSSGFFGKSMRDEWVPRFAMSLPFLLHMYLLITCAAFPALVSLTFRVQVYKPGSNLKTKTSPSRSWRPEACCLEIVWLLCNTATFCILSSW